ncbi:hypothetical protein GWK91_09675 [Virgibacillus sp. MSP4-1]|nr:hypothetical protein GWK91_09675 [Virgibacillus sp. MSP4-1]
MVNDRNLTVHTYNEELAVEIFKQLPDYYELLRKWVSHIIEKFDRIK